jgi:amino acid adenylation domain-containing protein
LRERLGDDAGAVICIDDERNGLAAEASVAPSVDVSCDQVAYLIYTSGSTGLPKGVLVTHRNAVRLFSVTAARFGFHSCDTWTLFHSIAFDFSVWEMWGALLHGGRLIVVPYLTTRDPPAFLALLVRERVTMLSQTPSAFGPLIDECERARPESLPNLRWIVLGGEALNTRALHPWFERFRHAGRPPGRIMNMYGITETTVHVTWCEVTANDARDGRNDIGPPLPDLGLALLDPHGQPVPVGVPGEIWVRGAGVALGYLNRPELNAVRFVSELPGLPMAGRAYRSGDLARYRSDGSLEYIGRADRQVKIRGFRIELGEIEETLRRCAGVVKVLAAVDHRDPLQPAIVVFVVTEPGGTPTSLSLQQWLVRQLPTHLLPNSIVLVDEFPFTGNQKVDVNALLEQARRQPEPLPPQLDAAPQGDVGKRLAALWADILGHRSFGLHDRFFDVGGTSMTVMRLRRRVDEAFGVRTQVADYFMFPTLALLNEHVSRLANDEVQVSNAPPRQDGLLRRKAVEARRKRRRPQ